MKLVYLFIFSFISNLILAQTQDLYSLAKGEYLSMNALFDEKQNLYGYVALYNYGKLGDKTKKFEYVLLDKNLNPVANKEFEGDITAGDYYGYINFDKKMILRPSVLDNTFLKGNNLFMPRAVEVDLNNNTVVTKNYYDYEEGIFHVIEQPKNVKENRNESRNEKKAKGYKYVSRVYEVKEGGYIVSEYKEYNNYSSDNNLIKFDKDRRESWRYAYNINASKKNRERLIIVDKNNQYIYAILGKKNNDDLNFNLVVLDMNNGKEVYNQPITNLNPETLAEITYYYSYGSSLDNDKVFDDKIVLVGRYYDQKKLAGFARLIIDKKNFSTKADVLSYNNDFTKFLPSLTRRNVFEDGYELRTKDFFFLQDGSMGILMEKYKPQGEYTAPKTTDLIYAFTDSTFKLRDVQLFKKDLSKWDNNDYLFSQYLNNGKDVVFFYRDLQKENNTKQKNWKLFINTLIDGKFKQEQIQISEKDAYNIIPHVGKEGYILLREFNAKDKKYNKIRLERLNY